MHPTGPQRGSGGPLSLLSGISRSRPISGGGPPKGGPSGAPSVGQGAWDRPGFLAKRLKMEPHEEGGPSASRNEGRGPSTGPRGPLRRGEVDTIDLTITSDSSDAEGPPTSAVTAAKGTPPSRGPPTSNLSGALVSNARTEEPSRRTVAIHKKGALARRQFVAVSEPSESSEDGKTPGRAPAPPHRRPCCAPKKGPPLGRGTLSPLTPPGGSSEDEGAPRRRRFAPKRGPSAGRAPPRRRNGAPRRDAPSGGAPKSASMISLIPSDGDESPYTESLLETPVAAAAASAAAAAAAVSRTVTSQETPRNRGTGGDAAVGIVEEDGIGRSQKAGRTAGIGRSPYPASQEGRRNVRDGIDSTQTTPTLRRHLDPFYGSAGKIARVVLRDFCNHEHLDWRPSPFVNLILGRAPKHHISRKGPPLMGGPSFLPP